VPVVSFRPAIASILRGCERRRDDARSASIARHDRPGRAAAAEQHGALALRIETGVVLQRAGESADVGVVADEFSVAVHDGVDRARLRSKLTGVIEQRHDGLLVRDRHVRAEKVGAAQ
jgi:hypothetical protein